MADTTSDRAASGSPTAGSILGISVVEVVTIPD